MLAWRPYACCYRGDASAPWAVATFPASLRYALRRLRSGRLGKYTWATCLTGSRASRGGCEWPWLLSFLRRHDAGWHDCPAFSCALARTTAQTPRAREVPGVRPTNSSSRVACSLSLFPRPPTYPGAGSPGILPSRVHTFLTAMHNDTAHIAAARNHVDRAAPTYLPLV